MGDMIKDLFGGLFTSVSAALMKVLGFLALVLVLSIGIFGYTGRKNYQLASHTVVDNPTEAAITFQLDGKEYTVEAKSTQEISLSAGEHTLIINGETMTFEKEAFPFTKYFTHTPKSSVLNPTKSEYILGNQIYVFGYMSDKEVEEKLPKYDCVDEKGNPDKCFEKYLDDVLIQERFTYGLGQNLPESAKGSGKYVIYSKLFRLPEYREHIKAN